MDNGFTVNATAAKNQALAIIYVSVKHQMTPKIFLLTNTNYKRILSKKAMRNKEILLQSSFRPGRLQAIDEIKCQRCERALIVGENVVSRSGSNGRSGYCSVKYYHPDCARKLNII